MRRSSAGGLAAVLVLTGVALGSDAQRGSAHRLLDQAKALYIEGYFEIAERRLTQAAEQAVDAAVRGEVLMWQALCLAAQGRPVERVRELFHQALAANPALTLNPAQFKPSLVERFQRIKSGMSGRLRVDGDLSEDSSIWLAKRRIVLPHTDELPIGVYPLEVRFGPHRHRRTVRVFHQRETRVSLQRAWLEALFKKDVPNPAAAPSRFWTWISSGATATAAAVAITFTALSASDRAEGRELLAGGLSEAELQRIAGIPDSIERNRTVATVSWGVATVFAVSTLLLAMYERSGSADVQRPRKPGRRTLPAAFTLADRR